METNELIWIGTAFVVGALLTHVFWLRGGYWMLEDRWWGFHHKRIKRCEGCEECVDEEWDEEAWIEKWSKPRWNIGLSFKPKGDDPMMEDDVLRAKVGIDFDSAGYCCTHGVRDIGWTFFDDYARAHAVYHMLREHMPTVSDSWGIVTQYDDGDIGRDWDWRVNPGTYASWEAL